MLSRNLFREISILKIFFSRNQFLDKKKNFREISILELLLSSILISQTYALEKFILRNLNSQNIFLEKSISRLKKKFSRNLNSRTFIVENSQFSN